MKKGKLVSIFVVLLLLFSSMCFCLTGCEYKTFRGDGWKNKYDISLPNLTDVGDSKDKANEDGWYSTMIEEFDGDSWQEKWKPIGNTLRNEEYW